MENQTENNNSNIYINNLNVVNENEDIEENNNKNKIDNNQKLMSSLDDLSKVELSFKIILIGNCGVGKTCILNKALKSQFIDGNESTIGIEFLQLFALINNKIIKLQIWDTCGQEGYRSLISNYYRNSSLAIIVYAIDDKKSFEDIEFWIKELKSMSSPEISLVLIGNKKDLEDKRVIKYEEGKKLANHYGFNIFFETSSKTGENIEKMFIKAARILYENYLSYYNLSEDYTSTKISKKNNKKKKKKCC